MTTENVHNVPAGFCHCGCGGRTELRRVSDPAGGIPGEPRLYMAMHQFRKAQPLDVMADLRGWVDVKPAHPAALRIMSRAAETCGLDDVEWRLRLALAQRVNAGPRMSELLPRASGMLEEAS